MKASLLIVDDEANTLATLSRAFRLAGHEATVADHAGRALELVRTQSFDLIFSDVVMPDKDGITSQNFPVFKGTALPGQKVTVTAGTHWIGEAVADAQGNWPASERAPV